MNGTADFQVANALAAIAACRVYGLPRESGIHLQTFRADANNPGRNNLYRVGQGYALVDYGHNPGAFDAFAGWRLAGKNRRRRLSACRATVTIA
jgi:cyanophycin synthetase